MTQTPRDYIEACVAEMDERPPQEQIDAAVKKIERYTNELINELSPDPKYAPLFGWEPEPGP